MDKLDKKQKEAITKLSTVRLSAKLALAGLDEEELETLNREQLLEKWAEIVVAGKAVPSASKGVSSIEIEREKLQFEKEKFAAEAEERRLSREAEERRVIREAEALTWERSRLEEERVERQRERQAEAERAELQLKVLQKANSLQREAIGKEREKRESVSSKLKQYGDAIRNSITKMSGNPTELIVFLIPLNVCLGN